MEVNLNLNCDEKRKLNQTNLKLILEERKARINKAITETILFRAFRIIIVTCMAMIIIEYPVVVASVLLLAWFIDENPKE